MKHLWIVILVLIACLQLSAQDNVYEKLEAAWNKFSEDPQLKYALAGICVMDAQTGKVIFEKDGSIGMAPASIQKVITSIAAFEAFGPGYQYQTGIGYTGQKTGNKLFGDLVVTGNGDPTLASSRYSSTNEASLLANIAASIKQAGIDTISGNIIGNDKGFDLNPIPDGWIWGDMGNYYGAGHWAINWNENQYDLFVKTGSHINEPVQLTGLKPASFPMDAIVNDVKTGKPGSGDASVIYADPFSVMALYQGELEPNKSKVSGSIPNADLFALNTIKQYLRNQNIIIIGAAENNLALYVNKKTKPKTLTSIYNIPSPALDSIVYWFLQKSINFYGEALVRTIGMEKKGYGSTQKGLEWIDSFYTANGFDSDALHMYDGSGLSPANRVTPFAMTKALFFAKSRSWFQYFYDALPQYNGMKLKSGTISRVKCFAGYHTSKNGKQYIVSMMVNNYNSSHGALVDKMYTVLNTLK